MSRYFELFRAPQTTVALTPRAEAARGALERLTLVVPKPARQCVLPLVPQDITVKAFLISARFSDDS